MQLLRAKRTTASGIIPRELHVPTQLRGRASFLSPHKEAAGGSEKIFEGGGGGGGEEEEDQKQQVESH